MKVGGEYKYASAKEHYSSFAPAEFQGLNAMANNTSWAILEVHSNYTYVIFEGYNGQEGQAIVPIHIPDDAVITKLEAKIYDGVDSMRTELTLYKQGFTTNQGAVEIHKLETSDNDANGTYNKSGTFSETVDNEDFTYYIRLKMPANPKMRLYGCRIKYQVNKAD